MRSNDSETRRIVAISAKIQPILFGLGSDMQGFILADLVAMWIVGHHPDAREIVLDGFYTLVDELVEINDRELYGPNGFPMGGLS